jgi:hypothetical protein
MHVYPVVPKIELFARFSLRFVDTQSLDASIGHF